jgi:PAS domain S-box-containing protein
MDNQSKPKKQLINELSELRQQLVELNNSDAERTRIEEDLQDTKKKLQSLFDGIPMGLYRTTPEGRRLDVNSTLLQMARCPDRETFFKGNVMDDYINPEDRKRWQALMEREGIVCGFEAKCRRYDGTAIWIRDTARIVHDSKGQVLYYEGAVEDITEHKRAERKERQYANNLAFLSRTAMEFVEFPSGSNIYKFVGERMRELVDNSLVIVNSFDEATQCIQVRALVGISKRMSNIIKILGKNPIGMSFPINDEARAGLATGKLVKVPGGLHILTFEKIPKYTCSALEKLLGLKNIYVIGFARKGELFGSIVILSRNGDWLEKRNLIEAFVGQSSVALQKSWAEEELKEYREHLEEMVGKRTVELEAANKKLQQEITERKNAEKKLMTSKLKLQKQKSALKQKNIALREVIAQIEMERKRIKEDIESNVNIVISPIIEKLKMASMASKDKYACKYVYLLLYHLKKITSSSGRKLTDQKLKLTPREIEICNMVKGVLTSKEISNILNISCRTVEKHRQKIRHKLGISNQDVNLASFLREL